MTRKIVALCLLILIPVTLNCMAGFDMTAAWSHMMGRGKIGNNWQTVFEVGAFVACLTVPGIGFAACGIASIV